MSLLMSSLVYALGSTVESSIELVATAFTQVVP